MANKYLSVFAERMMPSFVHQDHLQFTKFIKYYFEFLEQTDGVYDYAANSLEYMDIDYTKNSLLEEFRNTYLLNFPEETGVDVRFLVKHIREFYKSKGSEKSYEFLFRLLYGDDDIDIYYPKLNILRCSDGKWDNDAQEWLNTDGFLSSDMKLQDNYYYQDFSYEIITDVTRFYYENVVKQNIHVAGQLMFGRNILETDVPLSVESMDYDKFDRLDSVDLGLITLWGGTPYVVSQTEKNSESILIDVNGDRVVETLEFPFVSIQGTYQDGDVISMRRLGNAIADNESFVAAGTTYTLDGSYTANQLMVWVGNKKQYNTIDFTISGTDIIFGIAPTEKVYVLKHTMQNVELISGVGTDKHIVLTNDPQGYLLNKIIVFFNGSIVIPEWYDPLTKRVYFDDYVSEGTDNIEVLYMESLGYVDSVTLDGITAKHNIATNKNEFLHLPKSPYVVLIQPLDNPAVGITDAMLTLNVFVTKEDIPTLSLIERTAILLRWTPQDINILTTVVDGGAGYEYDDANPDTIITTRIALSLLGDDIYFTDTASTYVIHSLTVGFGDFVAGDVITVTTEAGINDGDYTVISATATEITVTEVLLAASAGAVGNTSVTRRGLFADVRASDWITISGSGSNDGIYLIGEATDDTLTLAWNYGFVAESNDTSGTITVDREFLQDRLYTTLGEVFLVTLLWDVADDVLLDPDIDSLAASIAASMDLTDSVLLDPDVDATAASIIGTISARADSTKIDPDVESVAASVVQTLERTDISFTANSTISTVAGDFTVFDVGDSITVVSTSTTNDATYTIDTVAALTITVTETSITTEDAATAGTVSISRTI